MLRACRWVTTPLSMFRNLSLQKAIACLVSCQTLPVLRQLIWLRTFSKRSMSQRLAPWHSFGESEEHRTSYLAQGNHGKTEPAVSSFLNFFPSWIFFCGVWLWCVWTEHDYARLCNACSKVPRSETQNTYKSSFAKVQPRPDCRGQRKAFVPQTPAGLPFSCPSIFSWHIVTRDNYVVL